MECTSSRTHGQTALAVHLQLPRTFRFAHEHVSTTLHTHIIRLAGEEEEEDAPMKDASSSEEEEEEEGEIDYDSMFGD